MDTRGHAIVAQNLAPAFDHSAGVNRLNSRADGLCDGAGKADYVVGGASVEGAGCDSERAGAWGGRAVGNVDVDAARRS